MKVVFRVDASGEVGFGHLSRCINLAEVLRSRGSEVSFVCRDDEAKSFNFLEKRLLKALPLPSNTASSKISQETEDDETIDALDGVRHSWLIVDGYKLDGKFEEKLRRYVKKLLLLKTWPIVNITRICSLTIIKNIATRANHASD
jgi:UDP-2,4-diacetamido-2,4,6-trideoxy-beta-L-altropyranose hydrolase